MLLKCKINYKLPISKINQHFLHLFFGLQGLYGLPLLQLELELEELDVIEFSQELDLDDLQQLQEYLDTQEDSEKLEQPRFIQLSIELLEE